MLHFLSSQKKERKCSSDCLKKLSSTFSYNLVKACFWKDFKMRFGNIVFCWSNLTQEQILGNLEEWLNNTLLRSSLKCHLSHAQFYTSSLLLLLTNYKNVHEDKHKARRYCYNPSQQFWLVVFSGISFIDDG